MRTQVTRWKLYDNRLSCQLPNVIKTSKINMIPIHDYSGSPCPISRPHWGQTL
jgi:hypothetical protein